MRFYSQNKWTKHSARLKIFQALAFSIAQKAIATGIFKVDDKEIEKLKKYKFEFLK